VRGPGKGGEGLDRETKRTAHEWLARNGCRGIVYAIRERHDRTFGAFWREDLGLEPADDGYDWGIEHGPTIEALEFLHAITVDQILEPLMVSRGQRELPRAGAHRRWVKILCGLDMGLVAPVITRIH
jgi:hypothetical protein